MTTNVRRWCGAALVGTCTALAFAGAAGRASARPDWNPQAAAAYLDGRAAWWVASPAAARDHGTVCISCHTTLPYALARSALRSALGEPRPGAAESRVLDSVVTRVTRWSEVEPFYPDQTRGIPKTSESRGTEAVLNAVVLATRDRERGRLTPETRAALEDLWALQMKTGDLNGAWAWLNFHNEPWEANGSPYFGAALAAIAVGTAPESYATRPEIQDNVSRLRGFLRREPDSLFSRLMLLWASGRLPGLLDAGERQQIIDATVGRQLADGGWSLATLDTWTRADGTPLDRASDGCATGLAALALQEAGLSRADAPVARGLEWLRQHQDPATGRWWASSLNKKRDPASDTGKLMSDAATAYAVLALTRGQAGQQSLAGQARQVKR